MSQTTTPSGAEPCPTCLGFCGDTGPTCAERFVMTTPPNAPEVDVLAVLSEMKINASLYRTAVQGDGYKPSEISWLMERDENAISAVAAMLTREAALVAERNAWKLAAWQARDERDAETKLCNLRTSERDALAAEAGALREDAERLDWIDAQEADVRFGRETLVIDGEYFIVVRIVKDQKSISGHPLFYVRDAIDAARAEAGHG